MSGFALRRGAAVTVVVVVLSVFVPAHAGAAGATSDDLPDGLEASLADWHQRFAAYAAVSATVWIPERNFRWSGAVGHTMPGQRAGVDSPFRIASATKPFTATVVLQLVEEGRLSLDDPLARWYPRFPNASQITVRHLLQHMSGIKELIEDVFFLASTVVVNKRMWHPDELIEMAGSPWPMISGLHGLTPRRIAVGAKWQYAQPNYHLLGRIIEKVTGTPYAHQVRTRIIEPLGLEHTQVPTSGDDPAILGWSNFVGFLPFVLPTALLPSFNSTYSAAFACGSIVSTPGDVVDFQEALHTGRLLSQESLDLMKTTVDTDPAEPDAADYGLGIERNRLGTHETWGHDGGMPAFRTINRYEPAAGVYVVIAANTDDGWSETPGKPPPPGSRRLSDLATTFLDLVEDASVAAAA